jgi:hypothetical protein
MDTVQVSITLNQDCNGGNSYTVEYSTDCITFLPATNVTFTGVGDTKTVSLPADYTCMRLVSLNGCGTYDVAGKFTQTIVCTEYRL